MMEPTSRHRRLFKLFRVPAAQKHLELDQLARKIFPLFFLVYTVCTISQYVENGCDLLDIGSPQIDEIHVQNLSVFTLLNFSWE